MEVQTIKCMIVGDSGIGKTDLFLKITTGKISTAYSPTVFDIHTTEVDVEDKKYSLGLWDVGGNLVFDEIRPICYPHTDCFLLCYSIENRESFENVDRWVSELRKFGDGPSVPIILAGLQSDSENGKEAVSQKDALELVDRLNLAGFFECFPKSENENGIQTLFRSMVDSAVKKKIEEGLPPNPIWRFESLKILIVGDATTGKSSISHAYSFQKDCTPTPTTLKMGKDENTFQFTDIGDVKEYEPTSEIIPRYADFVLDGTEYFLEIVDLPSAPEFLRDRVDAYEKANGIILTYAVNDPFSFQNVEQVWLPEVKEHCSKGIPFIIVGNKQDVISTSGIIIPSVDGEELMLSLGAKAFLECSAKTGENISDIFHSAAKLFKKEESDKSDISTENRKD